MALEAWEVAQRQTGNLVGAEIALVLRKQFGDIPFVNGKSSEQQLAVVRFSDEARTALLKEKYLVYTLTGQSINSLREAGRPFWSTWHRDYPDFEALRSRTSEVAINPDPKKFFLPNSNNKTLEQQEKMVADFSKQLTKKVVGVKALLGEAPDYEELVFLHLDRTREYLFGESYGYNYTRTKTLTGGSGVASVGAADPGDGLNVRSWYRDDGRGLVFAAPLVVPA